MLLTLVVRHGLHEKRDSPLQGRSSVYFLATVPSNQGSGSPEFGSPFPRIQAPKNAGSSTSAAGQWNDGICSYPPASVLWINDSAHQNCPTDFEAILTHN